PSAPHESPSQRCAHHSEDTGWTEAALSMKSIAEKGPMLSSPKLSAELCCKLIKFLIEINDDT
ncbi:hypothetical protein, partial [Methanothrix soehngenii]|uniref:hypothetical protein n=1 Tax=Methanothrix soehngenii TaxID=2223 RepID=UPI002B97EB0F|nr:hypothetical protein [Methanothrix soehngenii]